MLRLFIACWAETGHPALEFISLPTLASSKSFNTEKWTFSKPSKTSGDTDPNSLKTWWDLLIAFPFFFKYRFDLLLMFLDYPRITDGIQVLLWPGSSLRPSLFTPGWLQEVKDSKNKMLVCFDSIVECVSTRNFILNRTRCSISATQVFLTLNFFFFLLL